MPINLQGSGSIYEGTTAPKLDAPALGGLVATILANKLARDKMTQENIAETIKNVREERQGNALLDAMKAQGLVPEGYDAGGIGGAKLGVGLAKMIEDKKEEEARIAHWNAMEARVGGRGGRGSRGDGGVTPDVPATAAEIPDDYYGLSVAPGAPSKATTRVINGIVHVPDGHGGWKHGPEWMQKRAGQGGAAKPTNIAKDVKERLGLIEAKTGYETDIAKEKAANMAANKPGVHFSHEDEYNLTVNRLKQLQDVPGMPSTEPAVPQRPPAETGEVLPTSKVQPTTGGADKNLAPGYGVQGVKMKAPDGTVKTVDPNHVDYYKAKGAVVVP